MVQSIFEMGGSGLEDCDCCKVSPEETPSNYGCKERKEIFTSREQEVLYRIREAGERARHLKKRLSEAKIDPLDLAHRKSIEEELDELRRMRPKLEEERLAAAEERMRYLGHA